MPTNPTTKSQVQAYRFMLRRMESALVRKDAVMLHDPMRSHLRASAVGLILGVLGLAAFFVLGLFNSRNDIAIGDIVNVDGTTRFLVAVSKEDDPNQRLLVPVSDVTTARLLVIALDPGVSDLKIKKVDQSDMDDIPILLPIELPDAPQDLPEPERLIDGAWSACDTAVVREELPNAEANPDLSTTVIVGGERGDPLGADQALLLEDSAGAHYLVWNGQRLPVELAGRAVRQAYELTGIVPRKVSDGLLNAIPQGDPLVPPEVPGAEDPFSELPDVQVGDVVEVDLGEDEYFLILKQGKQPVAPAVARLIRSANSTSVEFKKASPEAMDRVQEAPASSQLNFGDFPPQVPRVLGVTDMPVTCLVSRGAGQESVITASADGRLLRDEGVAVPDAGGLQADRVVLQGGRGALVYGVEPGQQPNTGQIWLVTDLGQIYGVPSIEVARALGLGDQVKLAPEAILKLLKEGPELNPENVRQLYQLDPE